MAAKAILPATAPTNGGSMPTLNSSRHTYDGAGEKIFEVRAQIRTCVNPGNSYASCLREEERAAGVFGMRVYTEFPYL